MEEKSKKSNKGLIIGLVVALIFVIAVAAVIIFVILKKSNSKPEEASTNTIVTSMITEEGQEVTHVSPGNFTIEMKLIANSADGETFTGTIANARENLYQVYVTIAVSDTGEQIFRSGLLPVGTQIDQFTLDKKLDSGSYDCVVTFHNIDEDGVTEVSSVNVAYTLNVE